jgi:adenine-specific DNA-methyltransferase
VKGFVPTPKETVNQMVDRLFQKRQLAADALVLDPGSGEGEFIDGILSWCKKHQSNIPRIVGIESNPTHVAIARARFRGFSSVEIRHSDFLKDRQLEGYDFIVGNPPYVPITELSESEKGYYRDRFKTATGRFDLYLLFFEQALSSLKPGGRLVFITPEKFLYVDTAAPLRRLLAESDVEEIRLVNEETFPGLVTYPTITTVTKRAPTRATSVVLRDGSRTRVGLTPDGSSWLPILMGSSTGSTETVLEDVCVRISCGVATGADDVFVKPLGELDSKLTCFSFPTIAGRELSDSNGELHFQRFMLVPYDLQGNLIPESQLGSLGDYLSQRPIRALLNRRTCVQRKPWYAFHETPPLQEMLRPKILCKDITAKAQFWIDREGKLIPRHSVYYLVPNNPSQLDELCDYLNSDAAGKWLDAHCQRAANGFLRVQSHALKKLPVPSEFSPPVKDQRSQRSVQPNRRARKADHRTSEFQFER